MFRLMTTSSFLSKLNCSVQVKVNLRAAEAQAWGAVAGYSHPKSTLTASLMQRQFAIAGKFRYRVDMRVQQNAEISHRFAGKMAQ